MGIVEPGDHFAAVSLILAGIHPHQG
jgi:hypothetical protein